MSHELNLSSSEFINFSCNAPVQQFVDTINNVSWEFRQGGPVERDEAVIIISGIYDTTNSMYIIGDGLIKSGYRVLIISIPPYESVSQFLTGFDLLTASKMISKVHLVGFGFGGFLALHLTSFHSLSAEIISLTLIASYMETKLFNHSVSFFTALTGKGDLIDEVSRGNLPKDLEESTKFIINEIKSLPSSVVSARIHMRAKAPRAPLPKLSADRILIVQPTDWAFKFEATAIPQKMIKGAKYIKIEKGGHHPHLANPDVLIQIIKEHISNFHPVLAGEPLVEEID
ncbi:Maspardin [Histomonas meleagridis]|uniref:Maspardin n=1 Tax=Histomonas meleagridis TaxID=135588 RepID=UPI003559E542|nr:Maspardin [Histomonas meleagridis]KAH0800022.1 Maspardin [Histomonas meleagridis]